MKVMFREEPRRESLECKSDEFCIASEVRNAREELKHKLAELRMWQCRSYFSTGNPEGDYDSIPVLYAA